MEDEALRDVLAAEYSLWRINKDHPGFQLEPTLTREHRQAKFGLKITKPGTITDMGVSLDLKVANFFPLGQIYPKEEIGQSKELTGALARLQIDPGAGFRIIDLWLRNTEILQATCCGQAEFNPYSGTFELIAPGTVQGRRTY